MIKSILSLVISSAVAVGVGVITLIVTAIITSFLYLNKRNTHAKELATCWAISTGLFSGAFVALLKAYGIL